MRPATFVAGLACLTLAACATAWGGVPTVYAYPVESISVPCAVVGYPTALDATVLTKP